MSASFVLVAIFVAVISLVIVIVHVTRLFIGCLDRCRATYIETKLLVAERNYSATVAAAKPDVGLQSVCERCLVAVLQANGGFPAAEGDDVGRQLVREVRKMYQELRMPTQAPERQARPTAPVDWPQDLEFDDEEPE